VRSLAQLLAWMATAGMEAKLEELDKRKRELDAAISEERKLARRTSLRAARTAKSLRWQLMQTRRRYWRSMTCRATALNLLLHGCLDKGGQRLGMWIMTLLLANRP
jgi:hypothetical protein